MFNPKTNISSKLTFSPLPESTKNRKAVALADSLVKTHAYELYELRGRIHGFAEQDWYQAQTDLTASYLRLQYALFAARTDSNELSRETYDT